MSKINVILNDLIALTFTDRYGISGKWQFITIITLSDYLSTQDLSNFEKDLNSENKCHETWLTLLNFQNNKTIFIGLNIDPLASFEEANKKFVNNFK